MLGGEFCDRALKLRPAFQVCREGPEFARDRSQCLDCRLFLLNDLLLCEIDNCLVFQLAEFCIKLLLQVAEMGAQFLPAERADPVRPGLLLSSPGRPRSSLALLCTASAVPEGCWSAL